MQINPLNLVDLIKTSAVKNPVGKTLASRKKECRLTLADMMQELSQIDLVSNLLEL